jgi:hypothetical protein
MRWIQFSIEDNIDWTPRNNETRTYCVFIAKKSIILVSYSRQYPAYTNTSNDCFGRTHARMVIMILKKSGHEIFAEAWCDLFVLDLWIEIF